jgi:hypothetical protein
MGCFIPEKDLEIFEEVSTRKQFSNLPELSGILYRFFTLLTFERKCGLVFYKILESRAKLK